MAPRRKREPAWRVFSSELNSADHIQAGVDTYDPNYIITELGGKINRVFITGVFTEKENVGSEDDPLWRARVVDPTGAFFISAGRFQPEAARIIGDLEPPQTLALVGKIRTFTSDDGRLFVSIRPETVKIIDIQTKNQWILDAAVSLLDRIACLKDALGMEEFSEKSLKALGHNMLMVDGVAAAMNHYNYDEIDISRYEQQAKEILVNLKDGLYDLEISSAGAFGSTGQEAPGSAIDRGPDRAADMEAKENIIRELVNELDADSKLGAVYQEVLEAAEKRGLTREDTEECVNVLMSGGVVFEPALGYLKSIDR